MGPFLRCFGKCSTSPWDSGGLARGAIEYSGQSATERGFVRSGSCLMEGQPHASP